MGDVIKVLTNGKAWEVYRFREYDDPSPQRIADGITTWDKVLVVVNEHAEHLGGYAFPEERTPLADWFSVRTEPEVPPTRG